MRVVISFDQLVLYLATSKTLALVIETAANYIHALVTIATCSLTGTYKCERLFVTHTTLYASQHD